MMQLHATHYGEPQSERPPVIILHGLFGSNRNWHPIAKVLSEHFDVYSLDLRNHGKSPHSDQMNYPHMAEDVEDFIEHHHFDSVSIIAHSMGGKAAMWLALNRPDLVHKLIVVDIAPVDYQHDFSEVLSGFKSIPLASIQSRKDADRHLSNTIQTESLRQFLLQNLQSRAGQYSWRINLDAIEQFMPEITSFPDASHLPAFEKRVLFVGGGQSNYLNKENQKQTRHLFPMASFSMIKNAGHWLHSEQPELFVSLITPYLSKT